MALPLILALVTTGLATKKAVEQPSLRLGYNDDPKPGLLQDVRVIGGGLAALASTMVTDAGTRSLLQAVAVGAGASVICTEITKMRAEEELKAQLTAAGGGALASGDPNVIDVAIPKMKSPVPR